MILRIILIFLFLFNSIFAQKQSKTDIQSKVLIDTTLYLLDSMNENKIALPSDIFKTSWIVIKKGDSIYKYAKDNYIKLNADYYELIFDLNPNIDLINDIKWGETILFPKLDNNKVILELLNKGNIISIERNKQKKKILKEKIDFLGLYQKNKEFQNTINNYYIHENLKLSNVITETNTYLKEISEMVSSKKAIFSNEYLSQIVEYSNLVSKTLNSIENERRKPNIKEKKILYYIFKDLKIKSNNFENKLAESDVKVTVKTLKKSDMSEISSYRIKCCPPALIDNKVFEYSYNKLSSPTHRRIPVGTYVFWAEIPDTGKIVSNKENFKIRKKVKNVIEIVIKGIK